MIPHYGPPDPDPEYTAFRTFAIVTVVIVLGISTSVLLQQMGIIGIYR